MYSSCEYLTVDERTSGLSQCALDRASKHSQGMKLTLKSASAESHSGVSRNIVSISSSHSFAVHIRNRAPDFLLLFLSREGYALKSADLSCGSPDLHQPQAKITMNIRQRHTAASTETERIHSLLTVTHVGTGGEVVDDFSYWSFQNSDLICLWGLAVVVSLQSDLCYTETTDPWDVR